MCLDILFRKKGLLKPNLLKDIDMNTLKTLLRSEFPDAQIYLSDNLYKTTTKEEFMRFLNDDKTDANKYISELYDCDDFSFRLMGQIHNADWSMLPFGILWTQTPNGGHAVNIFVDNNDDIWIVEPQNDNMFICPQLWIPYMIII